MFNQKGKRRQVLLFPKTAKVAIGVFIVPSSNLFSKQMMCHARSAWWLETKSYARTIAPPPPRFTRQPQKEKYPFPFRKNHPRENQRSKEYFFFSGLLAYSPVRGDFSESFVLKIGSSLVRSEGIGPSARAWQARILPLYDDRESFLHT